MSTWNCIYCTLINCNSVFHCEGCGSRKPQQVKSNSGGLAGLVPKFITDAVKDVSNAVNEAITNNSKKPALHHFVRFPADGQAVPNGPFISGNCRNNVPNDQSGSTFFVPSTSELNSTFDVGDEKEAMCSEIRTTFDRIEVQKEVEKIYANILRDCRAHNSSFIDPSFPHTDRSIGELKYGVDGFQYYAQPDKRFFQWLRPSQIYTKDGRICPWSVMNNPVPSDIEQGNVGDCWLISAMSLIAERPDVLDEIFQNKSYSQFGVYQVKVCIEGEWKMVIVDDFFPCFSNTKSLAMARGRRNQLWVPLIEKALAKEMGCYSKLRGASLTQGLSMLTGASCINYSIPSTSEEVDTLWAQLVSSKESGFIMACSSGGDAKNEYTSKGLLTNHAYSILDVVMENGHRLLRIRNPWGSFVWNGKWSDRWTGWTPALRQKLINIRANETGAFWMELDDFLKMFVQVTVCKLRPHWNELRCAMSVGGKRANNLKVLRIDVEELCEVSFMAFQKDTFKADDNQVEDLMICVHRLLPDGSIGELMGRSKRLTDRHLTTDEFFLPPGKFAVLCLNIKKNGEKRFNVNLVAHSSIHLLGSYIPYEPKMMSDSMRQVVLKDGELVNGMEQGIAIRQLTRNFRGCIIMAENHLEDRYLHVGIDCSQSMNIQSSRGSLQVTDVIKPLSRQILIALSTIDDMAEYKVVNKLKSLITTKKYIGREMCYEAALTGAKLQNYPPVRPDLIGLHSSCSIFSGL